MSSLGQSEQYQLQGIQAVVASDAMRKLMQMVERVARNTAAVLITGETGCGKEFIARALHHHSLRCNKPWIDVNCAALPEHLVESELFGYEKGAFSGADSVKPGMFEMANGGTLFLDEIGELEPKVQVKLLRVLDGVPYYRLGGNKKVQVDVRIVAATNQNLEVAVKTGRFRSDLFHRLSQIQLKIPPLRERPTDIDALAEFFLLQQRQDAHFSSATLQLLRAYAWPGNVRELRNVIGQVAMLADGPEISPDDLPPEITSGAPPAFEPAPEPVMHSVPIVAAPATPPPPQVADLDEMERQAILRALARTGGHQGMAADQLGISRRTLSRKLKQYNLQASEAGTSSPLGVLSPAQQQYYRAAIQLPVQVKTERGADLECRTVNISAGGMAVEGIDNPLICAGVLNIRFPMPDNSAMVDAKARIAWADVTNKAGLKFTEISPTAKRALDVWLAARQREEGWAVETAVAG